MRPVAPYIPLPGGLADPRATAGGVFDRIARLYDRARPRYPPAAVADLIRLGDVAPSRRILEIGCGTGQLTRDLAPTGAAVVCLEPGPSLAELSRANLAGAKNVDVVTTPFEAFSGPATGFDLVVAATAFHWIDPEVGYGKAATLLHAGGRLALLTNAHGRGGTHTDARFARAIRDLHHRLAPEVGDWAFPTADELSDRAHAGGDIAAVWARVERKLSEPPDVAHLFGPPAVRIHPWRATYDTDGYLSLLASQSSYALMPPARREELLGAIGRLVDECLGGVLTKEYVTILAVAPRRPVRDRPAAGF